MFTFTAQNLALEYNYLYVLKTSRKLHFLLFQIFNAHKWLSYYFGTYKHSTNNKEKVCP